MQYLPGIFNETCLKENLHLLPKYTHTHTHTHTYIYIWVCVYVCVCVRVHTHTHTHTHIYIYIYITEFDTQFILIFGLFSYCYFKKLFLWLKALGIILERSQHNEKLNNSKVALSSLWLIIARILFFYKIVCNLILITNDFNKILSRILWW